MSTEYSTIDGMDAGRENAWHSMLLNSMTQASQSLSKMLCKAVRLTASELRRVPLQDVDSLVRVDEAVFALRVELTRGFSGYVLMLLEPADAARLVEQLMPGCTDAQGQLNEIGQSCLQEIANIVSSALANSFAKWTNSVVEPTAPGMCLDMPVAALESVLAEQAATRDDVFVSRVVLRSDGFHFESDLFVLPSPQSFGVVDGVCE